MTQQPMESPWSGQQPHSNLLKMYLRTLVNNELARLGRTGNPLLIASRELEQCVATQLRLQREAILGPGIKPCALGMRSPNGKVNILSAHIGLQPESDF